jgi:uncharacterized membrane protein
MPVKKKSGLNNSLEKEQDTSDQDRLGLDRLVFFSDAVFAIAITLLVLEIRLPSGAESLNNTQLLISLAGIFQKFLAYVISFLVIGTFWIAHHRKFRFIKKYDRGLLFLNLLVLMVIGFIPFPSSLISENPGSTATIFYALTMVLAGLLMLVLWAHAVRHNRLIDPAITKKQRWREVAAPLSTVAIFLVSVGIAFFSADLARLSWLLILPSSLIVNRK